jgi:hypothetical protein
MTAIAKVEEAPVLSEGAAIIQVIERAALNPDVDVEKMERLYVMHERVMERQAERSFNDAMNRAQADLGRVAADADNPQTKSKYASYAALDREVRPVYSRHGFSLSFGTADGAPADCVRVTCRVSHADGYSRDYHVDMPADGKGAKGGDVMTKTHAVGAAMSYAQRYLLKLIFNIAVGDDRDGNAPPREHSEAAQNAIAEINACEDAASLVLWKKNKSAGVMKEVSDSEGREIIALFNRRVANVKKANADE